MCNIVPTPVNLKHWQLMNDMKCCKCRAALMSQENFLLGCRQLLPPYTSHQIQILEQIGDTICDAIDKNQSATILHSGQCLGALHALRIAAKKMCTDWLNMWSDWVLVMDGDGSGGGTVPGSVLQITLWLDIVIFSWAARMVVLIRLTVLCKIHAMEA